MSVIAEQVTKVEPGRPDPLENGDQLAASEFLRRYEAMPQVKKAELIEGVVYMGSPVRQIHADPDSLVQTWLGTYAAHTPGTKAAVNATVHLDADNVVQPDALLRVLPENGGRCITDEDGYLRGAPELVVEIAASRASIDVRDKLRVYRRCGVAEYLVWRTVEGRFDWRRLVRDEYQSVTPDVQGRIASVSFPGLVLDVAALLAMDARRVLEVVQSGLAGDAHSAFVARLAAARK